MPGLDKEGILERTNCLIKDLDIDDRTFEIIFVNSNLMDTTIPGTYNINAGYLNKEGAESRWI